LETERRVEGEWGMLGVGREECVEGSERVSDGGKRRAGGGSWWG
jgi:hypothetical protein